MVFSCGGQITADVAQTRLLYYKYFLHFVFQLKKTKSVICSIWVNLYFMLGSNAALIQINLDGLEIFITGFIKYVL